VSAHCNSTTVNNSSVLASLYVSQSASSCTQVLWASDLVLCTLLFIISSVTLQFFHLLNLFHYSCLSHLLRLLLATLALHRFTTWHCPSNSRLHIMPYCCTLAVSPDWHFAHNALIWLKTFMSAMRSPYVSLAACFWKFLVGPSLTSYKRIP
jgi:hypothetical protein